jgi:hypothetical protein
MSDILCGYSGERESALMAYLYDELAPDARADFDRHLETCARCRVELNGLGDVRQRLSLWSPPDFGTAADVASAVGRQRLLTTLDAQPPAFRRPSRVAPVVEATPRAWWRQMPAWAQVAAAMVVLGISAGLANLDVHYDARNGLNIRTGWSKPVPAPVPAAAQAADTEAWRAELTALEQRLRGEMHTVSAASAPAPMAVRSVAVSDTDLVRRVKPLLDESERRQQRELALRVAEVVRDLNVRRDADLRKIDQNLGIMLDRTGVEVMKNRQMIDYYLQRVSQRQ